MRKNILYFTFFLTLAIFGCESSPSNPNTPPNPIKNTNKETTKPTPTSKAPNCPLVDKTLEGNKIWFPIEEMYAAIISDSTTHSEEYGDIHRVFITLDKACNITFKKVLPENDSPDYGYFLAPINYNNTNQIVGIKGFDAVYIFDLKQQKLYPKLTPSFLTERLGDDAQSGRIVRLEVWENFLIGYAQDYGTFVFDLRQKDQAKALLPVAEYIVDDADFYALFALPTKDQKTQLIIPSFDFEKDEFKINPLLKEPLALDTKLAKNVKNNKIIIIRQAGESKTPLAINLKKRKIIALPEAIKKKKTSEILQWIKSQH